MVNPLLERFVLSKDVERVVKSSKNVIIPESREQLIEMSVGKQQSGFFEVAYEVPGKGRVVEATVTACKNGMSVNFVEPYMRRRDPDSIVIGDDLPTDKPTFKERFGKSFQSLR